MRKIYQIIANKEYGGGEVYAKNLGERMAADGNSVEFVILKSATLIKKRLQSSGLKIHEVSGVGYLHWEAIFKIARMLRTSDETIIHTHNFKAAFTAIIAKRISRNKSCKIVLTRHLVKEGKNTFLHKWIYGQIDKYIFVSQLVRDKFLSTLRDVHLNSEVIYNSIPIPKEIPDLNLKKKYGIKDNELILMNHGRICYEKGIHILLEAFSLMKHRDNCVLMLCGNYDNEYKSYLDKKISDLKLTDKVIFTGFTENVFSYISKADIGLLPTIVPEACPLSSIEYMSQGKVVVATNNGGQREFITDSIDGFLVPPHSASAIAQVIDKLYENKKLRLEIGNRAKNKFLRKLSFEGFIKNITQIYNSLSF